MKKYQNIGDWLSPWLLVFALLGLWELSCRLGWVRAHILPSPTTIMTTFPKVMLQLPQHLKATLTATASGFVLAIIFAIILAIIMDISPLIRKTVYPLLLVSQTVPLIVLAPLFVIWFGLGLLPKIIIVILICFFPVVVGLYDGLATVDPDLLDLMRTMKATPYQMYRHVKLPAAMTNFFSGLRIAATYSIMGAVIGEWMGGSAGLGIYMMRARSSFAPDRVFAVIVLIVILSIIMFKLIDGLQIILMPWSRQRRGKAANDPYNSL